jgi:HSP20 family molecular chaperone IbpA
MLSPFHDDFFFNDDFFDDFFGFPTLRRRPALLSAPSMALVAQPSGPQAHCSVMEDGLVLELEVPRFKKEHIKIDANVETGRLVINAHRDTSDSQSALHSAGTTVGSFRRAFKVSPRAYDLKNLTYTVEDGVLTIKIPQQPEAAPSSPKMPPAQTKEEQISVEQAAPAAAAEGAVTEPREQAVFEWPPRMDVTPKSDNSPLKYTITMPSGLTGDPRISIKVRDGKLLVIDVSYTRRHETEHSYSEQSGSFSRTFPLPSGATKNDVSARMEGKQLIIEIKH